MGNNQFFDYQSRGLRPENPDDYFIVLTEGKTRFDFLCREYEQSYENGNWWGFYRLWLDWKGDRWVLPHLCKWYKRDLPVWLDKEVEKSYSISELSGC